MLLTITYQRRPATDLGYLLHKHPGRVQTFDLPFGQAHIFYPQVSEDRCTVALLLDIDPVALVRGHRTASEGHALTQYVNDRPYVASSFMSVALAKVFGSAMAGRSVTHPERAAEAVPLEATIAVVSCRSGAAFLRALFEPLGYQVTLQALALDEQFPEWGPSPYYTVRLAGTVRLCDLLTHLYVLIPVLDDEKHYWVDDDEVEKLLRRGAGWLATHPERAAITNRYLKHQGSLTRAVLTRLAEDDQPDPDTVAVGHAHEEDVAEARILDTDRVPLNQQRLDAVLATLKASGAARVLDLGCGEGHLLQRLLADPGFVAIVGMDVSYHALERAQAKLHLDRLPPRQQARIQLLHGSLTYKDARLVGYDAAAVVEVIEHLDPPRLAAFERVLFAYIQPGTVVLTTPNADYNGQWPHLPAGTFRHRDHRFEWTRAEFQRWAGEMAERFGYTVRFLSVGPVDPLVGSPTQMGVFTRGSIAPPAR